MSSHSHAPARHRPDTPGGPVRHDHNDHYGHDRDGHGHSHGLVDASIKRSREGVRAVALALLVLGLTAAAQIAVFATSGSVALLADLIHNAGDARPPSRWASPSRCAAPAPSVGPGLPSSSRSSSAPRWPA